MWKQLQKICNESNNVLHSEISGSNILIFFTLYGSKKEGDNGAAFFKCFCLQLPRIQAYPIDPMFVKLANI